MVVTQKINPGFVDNNSWHLAAKLELPGKLPAESRLEIHSTDQVDFPFEVRLIPVREFSDLDTRTNRQFVNLILTNHAGRQSFELRLGDVNGNSWQCNFLRARTDGAVVTQQTEVNRDLVNQIQIVKREGLDFVRTPNLKANLLTRNLGVLLLLLERLLDQTETV